MRPLFKDIGHSDANLYCIGFR